MVRVQPRSAQRLREAEDGRQPGRGCAATSSPTWVLAQDQIRGFGAPWPVGTRLGLRHSCPPEYCVSAADGDGGLKRWT